MPLEYTKQLSSESVETLKVWKELFNSAYSNLMVEEEFLKDKSDLAYCHYRVAREYNRINVNKTVSDALSFVAVWYFQLFLHDNINDELQDFKSEMMDYVCEELRYNDKKLTSFLEMLSGVTIKENCVTFNETVTFTKIVKACFEFTNIYLLNLEE